MAQFHTPPIPTFVEVIDTKVMKTKQYILQTIILLLLLLWIPTGLDKLWDLQGFRQTLIRQPFPGSWAEVLYWLLPLLELLCALLLIGGSISRAQRSKLKTRQQTLAGLALSSVLMLAFTVFILLGVLGWYEQRPCGCGSVIAGLSWEQHLWFNLVFLLLSVAGWWLALNDRSDRDPIDRPKEQHAFPFYLFYLSSLGWYAAIRITTQRPLVLPMRYPRRFAPFPG